MRLLWALLPCSIGMLSPKRNCWPEGSWVPTFTSWYHTIFPRVPMHMPPFDPLPAILCHGPVVRKWSGKTCRAPPTCAAKPAVLWVEKAHHTCSQIQNHKMCLIFGDTSLSLLKERMWMEWGSTCWPHRVLSVCMYKMSSKKETNLQEAHIEKFLTEKWAIIYS